MKAICVSTSKVTHDDGRTEVWFVLGKARLAPHHELMVPRLKLCAAMVAVVIAEGRQSLLVMDVIMGYIHNQSR